MADWLTMDEARAQVTSPQRSLKYEQSVLDAVVAGACAFYIQFDGPPVICIGSMPYVTLCPCGTREALDPTPVYGWEEAIALYGDALRSFLAASPDKRQIAWRARPKIEVGAKGLFKIISRLAVL